MTNAGSGWHILLVVAFFAAAALGGYLVRCGRERSDHLQGWQDGYVAGNRTGWREGFICGQRAPKIEPALAVQTPGGAAAPRHMASDSTDEMPAVTV